MGLDFRYQSATCLARPRLRQLYLGYSGIPYIFDAGIPASAGIIFTLNLCLLSLCGYAEFQSFRQLDSEALPR